MVEADRDFAPRIGRIRPSVGRALVNGTPRIGGFPPSGFDPLREHRILIL